jgi:N-hydroxyarylamine O-acetyltransferase
MDDSTGLAYLDRLGTTERPPPDATSLRTLHRAHQEQVPFENLSIHLGEPISLHESALVDKLVARRRGGFCYELNGGFALLLEWLGYGVTRVGAAVYGGGGRLGPPFDHLALLVQPPDGKDWWLADVGFGAHSTYPLRLDLDVEQPDPGGAFLLRDAGEVGGGDGGGDGGGGDGGEVLQNGTPQGRFGRRGEGRELVRDVDVLQNGTPQYRFERRGEGREPVRDVDVLQNGTPQYRFERRARSLADFVPTCWWQQTSPDSHFTRSTICSRLTGDGRVSVSGHLLIRTSNGERHEQELPDDDALLAAYRDELGVVLDRAPVVRNP